MAKSEQMKTLLHNLFSFRRKNVYVKISANNQITGLQCDKKKLKEMRDGNVEKSTIDRKWDIFSCPLDSTTPLPRYLTPPPT